MPSKRRPSSRLARAVALLASDVDDGFDAREVPEHHVGEAWIYSRGRGYRMPLEPQRDQPPLASKGSSSRRDSSSSRRRVSSA